MKQSPLIKPWMAGEFIGTLLLVFFGCGSVAAAVTTGSATGVFQVALVWGLGVATAVYLTGSLSGAHLNPAVSLALAVWSDFPKSRLLPYMLLQLAGAFSAAALLYLIFGPAIHVYEQTHGILRGAPGSEASAMVFGEYFPNPGGHALADTPQILPHANAFATEFIATGILVLVILGSTDSCNNSRPQILTALIIGLTVTMLIILFGPLTMACLNPARDLGPRLFSAWAGWGSIPFTANGWGWLTVYIIAPLLGGLAGGGLYRLVLAPGYAGARS